MRAPAAATSGGVLMRVLIVSEVYPPAIGGPSEQSRQIAREIAARGHSVLVATRTAATARDTGVDVVVVGGGGRESLSAKVRGNFDLWREIGAILRSFRPDVIHAQSPGYPALFAALHARRIGTPVLVKYSGSSIAEGDTAGVKRGLSRLRPGILRIRERAALHAASCVWATTRLYADRLRDQHRLPAEKFWVRPNFIDISRFRVPNGRAPGDEFTLLVVARLKPHKGILVAIDALARLPRGAFRLRIAGDGPANYTAELRRRVSELGLDGSVGFIGAVPPDEVPALYSSADVLLVPSFEEAFGIVLLEAMAAGVPVIGSEVGGIPYVLEDGRYGGLFPAGDADALASAVLALAKDPQLRHERERLGRERAREFDLSTGVDDLLDRYRALCGAVPEGRQG